MYVGKAKSFVTLQMILISLFQPVKAESIISGLDKHKSDSGGISTLSGIASTAAKNSVEHWLNQSGTAQVKILTDEKMNFSGSSLDLLVPLYDQSNKVIFAQVGGRRNSERMTTNVGIGQRHILEDWILGYNTFYDSTWNSSTNRWGVGLEAWRDNLRLSSNFYKGISGWKTSKQHNGYEEKAADGWDFRVDGWLPNVPQVGFKAMIEKYYGRNVDLFNSFSNKQRNPHSVALGVTYTPVPIVSLGLEHKMGKGGLNDTQLMASFNYRFGETLAKQTSASNVVDMYNIANSRLDLVNRNNEIVMDYRQINEIKLEFPSQIIGTELSIKTFSPKIKTKNSIDRIEIDSKQLEAAGGKLLSATTSFVTIQMPKYQEKPIMLAGVAFDTKGNQSNIAETIVLTERDDTMLTISAIDVDKRIVIADGIDTATYTLHVKDKNNNPLPGAKIEWATDFGKLSSDSGITDKNGYATVKLSGTIDGKANVTATVSGNILNAPVVNFEMIKIESKIGVNGSLFKADGKDFAIYTVSFKDINNTPVAGKKVTWSTDFGVLSSNVGLSDENGNVSVKLSSTVAGKASVIARTEGASLIAPVVTFEKALKANISVDGYQYKADGIDFATYTVVITDSNDNPVSGQIVKWKTTFGITSSTTSVSDAQGRAQVRLSSMESGYAYLSAEINDYTLVASEVVFSRGGK